MIRFKYILLTLCTLIVGSVQSQTNNSVKEAAIDSVTIKAYRYTSSVKTHADGSMVWNVKLLNDLPKILGNADPIRYTQMLPGIQTNSEYRSGVNIQGCENSHNGLLLENVPIYNVNHLLGFFSTFNASHFSEMSVNKVSTYDAATTQIGGTVTMRHDTTIPTDVEGEVSLGLISSQGSLKIPINPQTLLTLSARQSYLNLLYSDWLTTDGTGLEYTFGDYNVTLHHKFSPHNSITLDYYGGYDSGKFDDADYTAKMKASWGNQMASIHWLYSKGNLKFKSTLFSTRYTNEVGLNMSEITGKLPSSIHNIGYKGSVQIDRWSLGVDYNYYQVTPQEVHIKGLYAVDNRASSKQCPQELTLYGGYKHPFTAHLSGNVGSKFTYFKSGDEDFCQLSPSAALTYKNEGHLLSLTYALGHQNLFQTGFTDVGLPTEFWFAADKQNAPQYAHSVVASGSAYLYDRRFLVAADLFYRRLYNQIEYNSSILDFVNKSYDLQNALLHGKGENYGFSLMLQKCTGRFTGWLSYTYTHARRTFQEFNHNKEFSASHERPHDLKAVVTYKPTTHWDFGGTFIYASGTPFTPPQSLSFMNGNILINYADYNSSRLAPYVRCDLSVNFKWKSRRFKEQGLNLSVYNTFANRNELFWRIKKTDDNRFAYRPVSFVIKTLPSISYYIKF